MKAIDLNIADYQIRLVSSENGPELYLHKKFSSYLANGKKSPEITINVHKFPFEVPASSKCVFHAPFVKEQEGILIERNPLLWSVWQDSGAFFIKTTLPFSEKNRTAILKISESDTEWDLFIDAIDNKADPLEYPLDGLILYYLTVIHQDIMIHASGVNYHNKGYIFTGVSGKGKTTMASLWNSAGSKVIHDDRIIIRAGADGFSMYNTPVYDNDVPSVSMIDSIYIISHGRINEIKKLNGAEAAGHVISNCIQHNWDSRIIMNNLATVAKICNRVPVYRLAFQPDESIINYILQNG